MNEETKAPNQWAIDAANKLYDSPDHSIWLSHGSFIDWCSHAINAATADKDKRFAELSALLDEAMKTTGLYINVPEFDRLKSIWTDYNKNLSS